MPRLTIRTPGGTAMRLRVVHSNSSWRGARGEDRAFSQVIAGTCVGAFVGLNIVGHMACGMGEGAGLGTS